LAASNSRSLRATAALHAVAVYRVRSALLLLATVAVFGLADDVVEDLGRSLRQPNLLAKVVKFPASVFGWRARIQSVSATRRRRLPWRW
jgi:hypothetical protein